MTSLHLVLIINVKTLFLGTKDPESVAVDAFTINWSSNFFYAFPPFTLLLRVLRKIQIDKAEGVVVAPLWPSQPWYPIFIALTIDEPIIFKPHENLLTCPYRNTHPLSTKLSLVASRLSGKVSTLEEPRKMQPQ